MSKCEPTYIITGLDYLSSSRTIIIITATINHQGESGELRQPRRHPQQPRLSMVLGAAPKFRRVPQAPFYCPSLPWQYYYNGALFLY